MDLEFGVETAFFDHNMDLIKNLGFRQLTLYFDIFTFLHEGLFGIQNLELRWLILIII